MYDVQGAVAPGEEAQGTVPVAVGSQEVAVPQPHPKAQSQVVREVGSVVSPHGCGAVGY